MSGGKHTESAESETKPRRARRWLKPVVAGAVLALAAGAGAAAVTVGVPTEVEPDEPAAVAKPDPKRDTTPLPWGPTRGELATARDLVKDWDDDRLAGQVIVGRFHGTDPAKAAKMVRKLHLAGVSVTGENVVDEAQVRETTAAVSKAVASDGRTFPAVIGVDQEGGSVSHLRGVATEFPEFARAGDAIEAKPRRGIRVTTEAARTTAFELRDLGFTWAFAPVADVTVGASDPTIGSRSPSEDPRTAAAAVSAAVEGYNTAGLVSTTKHFPGHGGVAGDTHIGLQELDYGMKKLKRRDLVPFDAAVDAGAPAVMVSHIDLKAIAPGKPASMAKPVYDLLREDVGFSGLAVTDSLGMGAVTTTTKKPSVTALEAGADLLLMPASSKAAHRSIVKALRSGRLDHSRVEEAAAKVVAMQLWQQRIAKGVPVPDDARAQAEKASAALSKD
ncbi:beta-N-acetylhexosaminidase [Nocardioides albertanoniae]|uniref:beta-N-acetylhexosaminidase n=1 Tax=Nocardioides albertanoniae TaxID=1175486 RepID=A0A543A966_9ACTN|nr:glycoside hydrolase family 3 N-terminal domain-containing protein [Nocardioides albertanoniae]TQL69147.1 beta-N-acetylhexosaminidase [Nocardioides albertanoniae]